MFAYVFLCVFGCFCGKVGVMMILQRKESEKAMAKRDIVGW